MSREPGQKLKLWNAASLSKLLKSCRSLHSCHMNFPQSKLSAMMVGLATVVQLASCLRVGRIDSAAACVITIFVDRASALLVRFAAKKPKPRGTHNPSVLELRSHRTIFLRYLP